VRLALLGATGRTGRLVLDQALAQGHQVTALARDPALLPRREALTVIQGDAQSATPYDALLDGAEAVLSALGPVPADLKRGQGGVMTRAAQQLLRAMPQHGVRRLVTLTGAGVAVPGDRPGPLDHLIRTLLRLTQPEVLRDSAQHVALIRASTLDWTVLRAPMLTDGPVRPVTLAVVGRIRPRVTRASVAHTMLACLSDPILIQQTLRQAPAISN
jgi:putative NADH-flavin reductase